MTARAHTILASVAAAAGGAVAAYAGNAFALRFPHEPGHQDCSFISMCVLAIATALVATLPRMRSTAPIVACAAGGLSFHLYQLFFDLDDHDLSLWPLAVAVLLFHAAVAVGVGLFARGLRSRLFPDFPGRDAAQRPPP